MTVPLTAEQARDRLDRGLPELARAGDDPAILSYALSALHGALEAHFRSVLASDPRVPAEIRAVALDVDAFSFVDIANALHEHLDLPASERGYILDALGRRAAQDHGDGFAWDRAGVEGFARYVAGKLGEPATQLDRPPPPVDPPVTVSDPPAPSPAPTAPMAAVPADGGRWARVAQSRPLRAFSALPGLGGLRGSHLIFILCALVAVSLLWNWLDSAVFDAASRAARPPVASPQPPAVASSPAVPSSAQGGLTASPVAVQSPVAIQSPVATPTSSAARSGDRLVVGNTDGEGVFLRRTPSMEDRLEPYDDGTRVEAVGPEVESEGRRWRLVKVEDGAVGWIPSQYLIAER